MHRASDYYRSPQENKGDAFGEQVESHFAVAFVQCGGPDEEG